MAEAARAVTGAPAGRVPSPAHLRGAGGAGREGACGPASSDGTDSYRLRLIRNSAFEPVFFILSMSSSMASTGFISLKTLRSR